MRPPNGGTSMGVVLFAIWIALGIAQISAFLAGIHHWLGVGTFSGIVIFFGTAMLPFGAIIDAAISFYGAFAAWNWPWWQAALLAFPFAIVGVAVTGMGAIFSTFARRGA